MDLGPSDEVIVPSYTFVSTANAFALRGAVPVFVDVREDTLNIDETLIEAAITSKTKAIVPVHYSGIACEMDSILDTAREYRLSVVEDAAQGPPWHTSSFFLRFCAISRRCGKPNFALDVHNMEDFSLW